MSNTFFPLDAQNKVRQFEDHKKLVKSPRLLSAYPALLSHSLLNLSPDYWSLNISSTSYLKKLLHILYIPDFLLKLFVRRIYILILRRKKTKSVMILTRSASICNQTDLDDFRFSGLTSTLKSLDESIDVEYFVHMNKRLQQHENKSYYLDSSSLQRIAELLTVIYFIATSFFGRKSIKFWYFNLVVFRIKADLIKLFLRPQSKCFYWDFNYQHYPLFLAATELAITCIGSMHGFHNRQHMPWMSAKDTLNSFHIAYSCTYHKFCDYNSVGALLAQQACNNKLPIRNIRQIKERHISTNLIIIQENQISQSKLLKWVASNFDMFSSVYIKLRPDKNYSDEFLACIDSFGFSYSIVDSINFDSSSVYVIGQCSTFLLSLALDGYRVIIFDGERLDWFSNPANKFYNYSNNEIGKFLSEGIIYDNLYLASPSISFQDMSFYPGSRTILANYYAFRHFKTSLIVKYLCGTS